MAGGRQIVIKVALAVLVVHGAAVLPTRAETVRITMENMVISPGATAAKVGDTVELTNKDVLVHSATARNGDFDVTMPPKKTVTMVLKKPGTIDYYCRFHPNMKAVLTVAP
jgi:plastocyanin